ncbi:MAG: hypothetical protein AVDCRST_MAG87-2453, partial [uncultured Thermomicrobiales bacterium]
GARGGGAPDGGVLREAYRRELESGARDSGDRPRDGDPLCRRPELPAHQPHPCPEIGHPAAGDGVDQHDL